MAILRDPKLIPAEADEDYPVKVAKQNILNRSTFKALFSIIIIVVVFFVILLLILL